MTERTRLISYLLYGLFSAEKRETVFNIRLRAQEVIRGHAIQTRRSGFFDNEAIFVFIMPRSRANLITLIFTMPGHYKKILPAHQPIRARVLL